MNLVDYTYFQKRLLAVPNLTGSNLEQLNDYIPICQDRYLETMLGVKLKNDFIAGLQETTIEQKWLDLRDGKDYEVSGISYSWKGFVNSTKESPIANYTFCTMTVDNQNLNTGIGEVRKKAENSIIITPQYRVSAAWSDMADMNMKLWHFLNEFYTESYSDWYPDCKRAKSFLRHDYNIGF